jgi:hypothetical protein
MESGHFNFSKKKDVFFPLITYKKDMCDSLWRHIHILICYCGHIWRQVRLHVVCFYIWRYKKVSESE